MQGKLFLCQASILKGAGGMLPTIKGNQAGMVKIKRLPAKAQMEILLNVPVVLQINRELDKSSFY